MTVVIRMKRTGRRNAPCYRISVTDKRFPRDGRTLETLGIYDPVSPVPELRLKLDVERARHWVQHGAQPSETVRSIFQRSGVYEGVEPSTRKRDRSGRKEKTATGTRRRAEKRERTEAKAKRHAERVSARRAEKKAAAAGAGDSAAS